MATKFGTATAQGNNSFETGRTAAQEALNKIGGAKPDLTIVFSSSAYDYAEVIKGVRAATGNGQLIGCSTAGEFTEAFVGSKCVACAVVSTDSHRFITGMGTGLGADETLCLAQAVPEPKKTVPGYPERSLIILMDGLAGKGEEVSLAALAHFGGKLRIAGGSAADDNAFKSTAVFSGERSATDALSACMVFSKIPVAIGVDHGHTPVSAPLTITKAVGNKVYELNGRPAIDVWMEATREPAKKFGINVDTMWKDPAALARFSFIYEGGLSTGKNYKIRWSGMNTATKQCLPFVCSMPEGAVMRIMESDKEQEIASARNAALFAMRSLNGKKPAGAIIFDCAVRGAILGADFYKAVDAVKQVIGDIPFIGLETYGELALEEGQLSGFHNTTTVVMLLPD